MKISIIGTGAVASALGNQFLKAGHKVVCIYGRDPEKAVSLSKKLHCVSVSTFQAVSKMAADVTLIAVNDDAIAEISKKLPSTKSLIVHTSGSVDMTVLFKNHKRCGVFYPVQTFFESSKIDFKNMPVCVETKYDKDLQLLLKLANSVTQSVYVIDSKQRLQLHLAAVIANNFSNHLFLMSEKILEANHLSFDLLRPIILTAAKNIQHRSPAKSQTGPAKRHNLAIIKKQMAMLKKIPAWQQLYQLISKDIMVTGD